MTRNNEISRRWERSCKYYNINAWLDTSIKNNYLKLKSEVGKAVLRSKQTKLVGIISTYLCTLAFLIRG